MDSTLARKLERFAKKELENTFMYTSWNSSREEPNNPGSILDMFGQDCDWKIRPKYFDLTVDPSGMTIEYESQQTAQSDLKNALIYFLEAHLPTELEEEFGDVDWEQFENFPVKVRYYSRDMRGNKDEFETTLC